MDEMKIMHSNTGLLWRRVLNVLVAKYDLLLIQEKESRREVEGERDNILAQLHAVMAENEEQKRTAGHLNRTLQQELDFLMEELKASGTASQGTSPILQLLDFTKFVLKENRFFEGC